MLTVAYLLQCAVLAEKLSNVKVTSWVSLIITLQQGCIDLVHNDLNDD